MKGKYYIAYGSNMDVEQMAFRCPDATLIGTAVVNDYELLFKGSQTGAYATIEEKVGSKVPVLIWKISSADEARLDRYEGFPTFYYKKDLLVEVNEKNITAIVYLMDESRILGQPTPQYYNILRMAYEEFGFEKSLLKTAYDNSKEKGGIGYVWYR